MNAREKKIKEVQEHNKQFLENYRPAMQNWYDSKKNAAGKSPKPPVYTDEDGKYYWANRKERKAAEARERRKK